jgi:hypothetical protein
MGNQKFNHPLCLVFVTCTLLCCSPPEQEQVAQANVDGIMFAILRNLDKNVATTDEAHGYAIMDFNPFSDNFGDTIQTVYGQLGHHGYISPINGSLYVTLSNDLAARVNITIGADGLPKIQGINPPLVDNDMRVGEDIVWYKENGQDRFAITSLDGLGNDILGGINVYDANTDQLLRSITDAEQLRYSHGISIFDDKPIGIVTSVIHEDVALTGVPSVDSLGHEVALINFETGEILNNYDLGTTADGFPVSPVECAIFRKSFHPTFEGNERALVVEMVSGNLVSANWNEEKMGFDDFQVVYSPQDEKEYFPLEIYADSFKIYITYAEKVKTFDLETYASSGQLVDAGVEYITKSCAHHLSFFDATDPATGETVPVLLIHQNLLNLGQQDFNIPFALPLELGMHEMTAYHQETGEILNTVNIQEQLGMGIEYVGGFNQNAYLHHH